MAYNRYVAGQGRPMPEMGTTTPGIEWSESERPAIPDLMPAPYLPVARFDDHKRVNIVLSAGTPVGLDSNGFLVHAGIPGGHTYVYGALDYATGYVASRKASDGTAVTAAVDAAMNSGLTGNVLGQFIRPIGVVSKNVFAFDGGISGTWPSWTLDHSNPRNYQVHNTMAQDLVAVTCDYALNVPYIYNRNLLCADTKIFDNVSGDVSVLSDTAKSYPFAHDELIATQTITLSPSGQLYCSGASGVMSNLEIVYVSPSCGVGISGVATTNDSYLTIASGTTGKIGFTAPGAAASGAQLSYTTLGTRGNHVLYGADTDKYIVLRNKNGGTPALSATCCFRLELAPRLQPYDYVVCRAGKFVRYDKNRHDADEIFGQVLRIDYSPIKKDYLDRVKTAYERSPFVTHHLAGSATRGVPELLHLVTDGAQVILETGASVGGTALTYGTTGMPSTLPLATVVINMLR